MADHWRLQLLTSLPGGEHILQPWERLSTAFLRPKVPGLVSVPRDIFIEARCRGSSPAWAGEDLGA